MKLELKDLAHYLPYNLMIQGQTNGEIAEMSCITETSVNITSRNFQYGMWADLFDIKPILRPLSNFRDKIIRDIKIELDCSINQVTELFCLIDGSIRLQDITLGLYTVLCKNHVDFNNLIENNLAIDINTI